MPLGNLTSQYFANLYLSLLDHFVKEKLECKYYVRYMDDFIIWNDDKKELKNIHSKCISFLSANLDLSLKNGGALNKVKHGFDFLGYRLFHHKIKLNKRSKDRFIKKFNLYEKAFLDGEYSISELKEKVQSLFNFVTFADTSSLRTDLLEKSILKDYF